MKKIVTLGLVLLSLSGCATAPSTRDLAAVKDFEINKYLGRWYEIARLENSFEKDLTAVSAEYKLRDDGKVDVINHGFNPLERTQKMAKGVANFVDDSSVGNLEVTFFWPFYAGYKILELDKPGYGYALVTSDSFDYLWILAREPQLSEQTYQMLVKKAQELGFNTDTLIKVSGAKIENEKPKK
jgi:apolipoprotein D and lipocalin family protein